MKKFHLFTLLLVAYAQLSCAASFDCNKAGTPTEKLICSDKNVSALDTQLGKIYKAASETAPDKDALKIQQRDWLKKKRNVCVDADCLAQAYQVRISELTASAGEHSVNAIEAKSSNYFKSYERSPLCEATLSYLNSWVAGSSIFESESVGINFFSEHQSSPIYKLPKRILGSSLGSFDFDNDGVVDDVFQYQNAGSYIYGTIIYVVDGKNKEKYLEQTTLTLDDIHTYPCALDKAQPKSKNCPPVSQDNDGATVEVYLTNSPKVSFSARYTGIQPFSYSGVTYLLLSGENIDAKGYWAVIQPTSKSTFKSVCIFKKNDV